MDYCDKGEGGLPEVEVQRSHSELSSALNGD